MTAYYNEIDPYAAQWLRNLITAGLIAPGDVDERDIRLVEPGDLLGYDQCHFFAGIGVWSYALRQAGWPDDQPVWTGSCPCQPFSIARKQQGFGDERHLWPDFHRLISQRQPSVVFGEQVSSQDGLAWLQLVQTDMEASGYAFGAMDTCAAGVGAPHIRQRLFFVADGWHLVAFAPDDPDDDECPVCGGDYTECPCPGPTMDGWEYASRVDGLYARRLEYASDDGLQRRISGWADTPREAEYRPAGRDGATGYRSPTTGVWRDVDWLYHRDDKWRPVEPGTFPLADGAASRMGRLRAYGNAIVAPLATEFIAAYMEACDANVG